MARKPDLNRLRVFHAVHQMRSILAAARALGVTPSAVSQSVKRLERELEFRLFQRVGNRLEPTDEAHELARVVADWEETLATTTEELRSRRHEPRGLIRFGSAFDFGTRFVVPAMQSLEQFRQLSFEMTFGHPDVLLDALLGGGTALAFCDAGPFLKKHAKLVAFRPVHRESLVLVCSAVFERKFVKGNHSARHLQTLPHIEYRRDLSVLNMWYRHHHSAALGALTLRLVSDNVQAVLAGIRADLGLGIVPEHCAGAELERGKLVKISRRKVELSHDIVLAQRKDRIPTLGERVFTQAVRKACAAP